MSRASVRSSKPAWHACRCSRIVRSRRGDDWWWEPGEPDLDVHVREEQPEPGERGFEAVCARLVMQPLPPDRPLWDLVLVPGARPGRCGIVVRFHHLLADGAHAVELIERLSDPGPAEPADAGGCRERLGCRSGRAPTRAAAPTPASPVRGRRRAWPSSGSACGSSSGRRSVRGRCSARSARVATSRARPWASTRCTAGPTRPAERWATPSSPRSAAGCGTCWSRPAIRCRRR